MKDLAKDIRRTWNPDLRIISLKANDDWTLDLSYDNGDRLRFDFRPYLEHPWYAKLRNIECFKQAQIDFDSVAWPGDTDIAPETLYEEGKSLK
ncbi:MAG: DUF2442 domain-containing protein [Coriobacteriales bacterium]|nr:DUF2442 domain-containing protein [Coriobacteriales bacterium]